MKTESTITKQNSESILEPNEEEEQGKGEEKICIICLSIRITSILYL